HRPGDPQAVQGDPGVPFHLQSRPADRAGGAPHVPEFRGLRRLSGFRVHTSRERSCVAHRCRASDRMNTAIIIGLGSDMGRELAARFAAEGWTVKGTHHRTAPGKFESTPCDLAAADSIAAAGRWLATRCRDWRVLVVAA